MPVNIQENNKASVHRSNAHMLACQQNIHHMLNLITLKMTERIATNRERVSSGSERARKGSLADTLRSSKWTKHAVVAVLALVTQGGCTESNSKSSEEEPTVEQPQRGKAVLSFDGYDWYFQGKYPNNFELQVFASTEAISTKPKHTDQDRIYKETVIVDEEDRFKLRGYSGSDETVWVTVKAFQQDGKEITISPNPGPEGMKGIPYVVNVDKLP